MRFTSQFLDINKIHFGDEFATPVYRKPTFSGVYTNYSNFFPEIYKSGHIRTLLLKTVKQSVGYYRSLEACHWPVNLGSFTRFVEIVTIGAF